MDDEVVPDASDFLEVSAFVTHERLDDDVRAVFHQEPYPGHLAGADTSERRVELVELGTVHFRIAQHLADASDEFFRVLELETGLGLHLGEIPRERGKVGHGLGCLVELIVVQQVVAVQVQKLGEFLGELWVALLNASPQICVLQPPDVGGHSTQDDLDNRLSLSH